MSQCDVKIPPQSLMAEKAILSLCLSNNKVIDAALKKIDATDFYHAKNKIMFETMTTLRKRNEPVDLVTLIDELEKNKKIDDIGGSAYICQVSDVIAISSNADEYIEIIKEKSERRKVITTMNKAIEQAYSGESDATYIAKTAVNALKMNMSNKDETGIIDIAEYYPNEDESYYIPSGFEMIDRLTDGFSGGMYTVITGKRGNGKSTIASQIALSSIDAGFPVCFYSGELSKKMFLEWLLCQAAGQKNLIEYVGHNGASRYKASEEVEWKIREWLTGKLYLYDNSVRKSSEHNTIIDRFSYAAEEKGCKLFFVDNLMSARFKETNERDFYRKQSMFAQDLLELSHEYNAHVILMAHPNKSEITDINNGVSGSADITNLASNVFSIERLEGNVRQREGADAILTIAKNRDLGTTAKIKLRYNIESRRYDNVDAKTKSVYGWQKELFKND
jgi:replicative DNA helicase